MIEIRWRQRHIEEGSQVAEWTMGAKRPRSSWSFAGVSVRWFPRLKVWRVLKLMQPARGYGAKGYLVRKLVAELPVAFDDEFTREMVGEQARQLAETTWRLENGE